MRTKCVHQSLHRWGVVALIPSSITLRCLPKGSLAVTGFIAVIIGDTVRVGIFKLPIQQPGRSKLIQDPRDSRYLHRV